MIITQEPYGISFPIHSTSSLLHLFVFLKQVSLGGQETVEARLLAALRVLLSSNVETVQKYDLSTNKMLGFIVSMKHLHLPKKS